VAEKQFRNHSVTTGVDAVPLDSESCRNSTELDCNVVEGETLGNKGSRSSSYTLAICKGVMKKSSPCASHDGMAPLILKFSTKLCRLGTVTSLPLYSQRKAPLRSEEETG